MGWIFSFLSESSVETNITSHIAVTQDTPGDLKLVIKDCKNLLGGFSVNLRKGLLTNLVSSVLNSTLKTLVPALSVKLKPCWRTCCCTHGVLTRAVPLVVAALPISEHLGRHHQHETTIPQPRRLLRAPGENVLCPLQTAGDVWAFRGAGSAEFPIPKHLHRLAPPDRRCRSREQSIATGWKYVGCLHRRFLRRKRREGRKMTRYLENRHESGENPAKPRIFVCFTFQTSQILVSFYSPGLSVPMISHVSG
ncbi:uncharacterized protein LOC108639940 [Manacus vitellinus]|uniref:uncharacterized protein LOC108639940 n=1 Tax=Manacus vitellinus TaxID=328815 RepID=UPI00115CC841|nr:uncharacterized protein LOC108639940 [Manacus vitellinus]